MARSVSTIALIEATVNEGSSSRLWYKVSRRTYEGGIRGRFASGRGDDEWLAVKQPVLAMWQAWGQRLRRKVEELSVRFEKDCAELDVSLKDQIFIKSTMQTRTSAAEETKRFNDVLARLMALSESEGSGGDGEVKEVIEDDDSAAVVGKSLVKQLEAQLSSYHSDVDSLQEDVNDTVYT
jgi:uncharacterized protein YgfB (UPF0149 family)